MHCYLLFDYISTLKLFNAYIYIYIYPLEYNPLEGYL